MIKIIYISRSNFKKTLRLAFGISLGASVLLTSCNKTSDVVDPANISKSADTYSSEVPLKWADLNLKLIRTTAGFSPPVASRALGYAGLTMYESVVAGMTGYQSLAGQLTDLNSLPKPDATKEYNWALVANSAEATILKSLFASTSAANKTTIDSLNTALETAFKGSNAQTTIDRSKAYGVELANAIFEWSKTDGGHEGYTRNFPTSYIIPEGVGFWQPTENGIIHPMQPYWGKNRTFVKANSLLPLPTILPASYRTDSDFYKEYKAVYDKNISLTQEEKEISIWWADDPSETFTPPGHSYSLAKIVVTQEGTKSNLGKAAETFAKVGISVADAFVSCWKCKYTYNNVRPYTYVRETIDPNWVPFWPAPPFPGFTSGHATQSSAAATALANIYGDNYSFTDNSFVGRPKDTKRNTEFKARSFTSFSQTAQESANSRFYGGIHTKMDNNTGLVEGKKIGTNVVNLKWKK